MIAGYRDGEIIAPFTIAGACNRNVFETWLEFFLIPTFAVGEILIMAIILKRSLAELDVLDIWDYIADDNPDRADVFLDRIESKLMTLAQISGLGWKRPELFSDLRSFPINLLYCLLFI
jgi:plasmid stabilization system protein ParE